MSGYEIVAYVAGAIAALLVCVSFFMKTIIPLRTVAAGSNVGFIVFGVLMQSWPVLILNSALLPLNCWRAAQMVRLTRKVKTAAETGDPSGVWLRPFMRTERRKAGAFLFHKGDPATSLYYLAEGSIEFVEIGERMAPGRIFGEVAFFTTERKRTLTARCHDDCTVLSIDEASLKELYYQNPDFGFHLVNLVARRLASDVERLEAKLGRRPTTES